MFDRADYPKLQKVDADIYYQHTMQLLYLDKHALPDIPPHIQYLTTGVREPNIHYWKEMACMCKHL